MAGIKFQATKPKQNLQFKHEREWPVILKAARDNNLTPEQTVQLLAMRETENGPKGYEFGVKSARGTNLDRQAREAAASIKKNQGRYNTLLTTGVFKGDQRTVGLTPIAPSGLPHAMVRPDIGFEEFMAHYGSPTGYGWAPVHANLPAGEISLNKNWAPNFKSNILKLQTYFKDKGLPKAEPEYKLPVAKGATFDEAFANARKDGLKVFDYEGKSYSTKVKGEE